MNRNHQEGFSILLVEDNPDDALLTKLAFEESKISIQIHVVDNGEEGLKFLKKQTPYQRVPRPHLILLDLNLPRLPGIEFLDIIKQDENFKSIPVIILSTSNNEVDIKMCYQKHANCYLTKPVDLEQFLEVARALETFWLSMVVLPPQTNIDTHWSGNHKNSL